MNLKTEKFSEGVTIEVQEPRVDMSSAKNFKLEMEEILKEQPELVILNLTDVEYFDSSALGTLVNLSRSVKSYGGEIRLCSLSQSLRTLLKLSKLELMFKIFDNVEAAKS